MKEWRVLVSLEYEWRVFRLYRKAINWLVRRDMNLTSPILCFISRKLDNHAALIPALKTLFEQMSGETVTFYQCDDY